MVIILMIKQPGYIQYPSLNRDNLTRGELVNFLYQLHRCNRTIFQYVSFCNQLLFDNIIYLPREPKGRYTSSRILQKGAGANGYIC